MKNMRNVIIGLVLIALGVLIGLNALDLLKFNIFFKGWWSLFIIIPCFIGVLKDKEKTSSILGCLFGVGLLLCAQEVITYKQLGEFAFPVILVVVGISFIVRSIFNSQLSEEMKKVTYKGDSKTIAFFSGQEINCDNKEFKGTSLVAVFGGIDLDLRKAIFDGDTIIKACCVFGGIDILVPNNVKVVIKSNSVFGGVEQKRKNTEIDDKSYTLYVDASCVFGGLDVIDGKR